MKKHTEVKQLVQDHIASLVAEQGFNRPVTEEENGRGSQILHILYHLGVEPGFSHCCHRRQSKPLKSHSPWMGYMSVPE